MNQNATMMTTLFLLLAAIAPAAAYHITAQPAPDGSLTSSDWILDPASPVALICESDGPLDPRHANPTANAGVGGLCTSGRQDYYMDGIANNVVVDGELLPPTTEAAAAAAGWTQLDICHSTVTVRAITECEIDTLGFTIELGVYECYVATSSPIGSGGTPQNDQSLFYEELYAWWSYDGNGSNAGSGTHGHVAVLPDPLSRQVTAFPPQPLTGSVYVAGAAPTTNITNCGASPAGNGPVVIADSSSAAPLQINPTQTLHDQWRSAVVLRSHATSQATGLLNSGLQATDLPCSASTLSVRSLDSVFGLSPGTLGTLEDVFHRNGSLQGPTVIQLVLGAGRQLADQTLDAPDTVTTSLGAGPLMTWIIESPAGGFHHVQYTARTECATDPSMPDENLFVAYDQWAALQACANEPMTGVPLAMARANVPDARVQQATLAASDDASSVTAVAFGGPVPAPGSIESVAYALVAPGRLLGELTTYSPNPDPAFNILVGVYGNAHLPIGAFFHGGTIIHSDTTLDFYTVRVPHAALAEFARRASEDPNVEYCEASEEGGLLFTPNDPLVASQYGLSQVNADLAWNVGLGSTATRICIIDSGVDYNHPDLQGVRWLGGYDYRNDDGDPMDDNGHGTHVTGIAAATTNNGMGVAGMARAGFLVVKIADAQGRLDPGDAASGIRWCADNDADVISMSFHTKNKKAVRKALEYAWDQDALLVAASGNSACERCVEFPARHEKVMAVTCTDQNELSCAFTSKGRHASLAAPGSDILSTCTASLPWCQDPDYCTPSGTLHYCFMSGTSMSAPYVAGAAALIRSQLPSISNGDLRTYLECSAYDLGPGGHDRAYGHGLLDAWHALSDAVNGMCNTGFVCDGYMLVNGLPAEGYHDGPSLLQVVHPPGISVVGFSMAASVGTVTYYPVGTDLWEFFLPGSTVATVTATAVLSCPVTLTASWTQTN